MISRDQVLRRASTFWTKGSIPYDQGRIEAMSGYRQDCSGYVSMCWGIPPNAQPGGWGGLNTVTLVSGGWMTEIPRDQLRPGDAVGLCGPGTRGDAGHIVIFERWHDDDPSTGRYWCWEQAGGQHGPVHRLITYPYPGGGSAWKAWRFRDIAPPTEGGLVADRLGNDPDGVYVVARMNAVANMEEWYSYGPHKGWEVPFTKFMIELRDQVRQLAERPPAAPIQLTPEDRAAIISDIMTAIGPVLRDQLTRVIGRVGLTVEPE